ncbi:MAG: DUF1328 domain-containing protein [Armatimonadota bacterium]
MLHYAIICLVIALVLAVLGFSGMAAGFVQIAYILAVVFVILAILSFFFKGGRKVL